MHAIPFHPTSFYSIPVHSIQFHFIPLHSIPMAFHSIACGSIPLHSIRFDSIPLLFHSTSFRSIAKVMLKLITVVFLLCLWLLSSCFFSCCESHVSGLVLLFVASLCQNICFIVVMKLWWCSGLSEFRSQMPTRYRPADFPTSSLQSASAGCAKRKQSAASC